MKKIALAALFLLSQSAFAGTWLATNATVEEVWSTDTDQDAFYVRLSGQTGPCTGIKFYATNAQSPQAYSHAFSLFTTALIHNKKVNVLSYIDDKCHSANFVSLIKG